MNCQKLLPKRFQNQAAQLELVASAGGNCRHTSRMPYARVKWFILIVMMVVMPSACSHAQQTDIARLVHPEVAERLSLTAEQTSKLQQLVLDQVQALAAASDNAAKEKVRESFFNQASELLTDQQREKLASDQPNEKLSFQFREMKWEQVLSWFADQQDLTLVMDRTPPGSFTYSDTRSYSPAEAIDLLNSVLMTRGFTLVRREKMLTVMELSNSLPIELLPSLKLDQLGSRGRFEIVSVVFPLGGRPIEAVLNEIKPYLNSYGRAVPLAQGSQVMVIENAGKMQTINELIASVPVPKKADPPAPPPPPPKPVLASYPLSGLDSTATLAFIRKLIPSENITVDDKAGILSAFVIPDQQTAIQSALTTMQEKHAELPALQAVAYKLSGIPAAEFRTQMSTLHPSASVIVTTDSALIVAAPDVQENIRTSLAALHIQPIDTDEQMQVFEVATLGASTVEAGLKKFFANSQITSNETAGTVVMRGSTGDLHSADEILKIWRRTVDTKKSSLRSFGLERRANAEWLSTLVRIVPNAKLWLAEDGRRLLVMGEEKEFLEIEQQLPQLQSLLPQPEDRQMRLYKLTKQQSARRSKLSSLPAPIAELTITETGGGMELLVWGTADQHRSFQDFLQLLDEPLPSTELVLQAYELTVQDSTTVLSLLTADFPEAKFTLTDDASKITALAEASLHEIIGRRVQQFNEVLTPRKEVELIAYQVPGMTAVQLQSALSTVLTKATVQVDATNARLLVWAMEPDHQKIAAAVELFQEKPGDRSLQIYALTKQQRLRRSHFTKLPADLADLSITETNGGAELLVWGRDSQHAQFEALLKQLDEPMSAATELVPQAFELTVHDSSTVLSLLTADFPEAKFTLAEDASSITALAESSLLERIGKRIQQFNSALMPRKELNLVAYQVPGKTAIQLQSALSTVLTKATVQVDAEHARLLVWATEEDHKKIDTTVELLKESPAVELQKVVVAYQLNHANPTAVRTLLSQLDPEWTIVADDKLKQIAVTATIAKHATIQAAIQQIDRVATTSSAPEIRGYDVKTYQASQLLPTLQSLWPDMKIAADNTSNKVIASGTPQELEQFSQALEKMLSAPAGKQPVVRTYAVPVGDMYTLPTILSQIAPQSTVSSDINSRTITVLATEELHERVKQTIEQVIGTAKTAKRPASYSLRPTQISAAQVALQSLFPGISTAADYTAGQLVVVANEQMQQQVAEVVELLASGPGASEKTVQTYKFDPQKYDLTNLLSTLQSLVPGQVKIDFNPLTGNLLAVGSEEELKQLAEQVQTLTQRLPTLSEKSSKIYKLRHAATPNAVAILQPLLPKAALVQDPTSRSISITGTEEDHRKAAEFLSEFDVALIPQSYQVKPTQVTTILTSLRTLFPSVDLSSDPTTGQVVVVAPEAVQSQVGKIVEMMVNGPGAADKTVQTFKFDPQKYDLTNLLSTLQSLVPGQVKIDFNPLTGNLLAVGSEEELKQLADQVQTLTQRLPTLSEKSSKIYKLRHAATPNAVAILQPLLPKAALVQDPTSRSISITGTEEDHRKASEFLSEFDVALIPQSYQVKPTQVTTILTSLRTLFPSVDLSSDPTTGQVVVVAPEAVQSQVGKIVEMMVNGPGAADKSLRVFPLKRQLISSPTFLTTLRTLVPAQVTVDINPGTETLLAIGSAQDLKVVEQQMAELETQMSGIQELESAVYQLKHANSSTAITVLQPLVPKATLAQDPVARTIAATATADDQRKIAELVQLLDVPKLDNLATKVYQLKRGSGRALAYVLREVMTDARLYGDAESGALLATATEEQHENIQAIVSQYESSDKKLDTRVFALVKADSRSLQSAIQELTTEAKASSDRATNSLIVTAPPEFMARIEQIVTQIDGAANGTTMTAFYPINTTDPSTLARALTVNYPKALVAGDTTGGGVFVTGTTEEHAEIRQLVEQLNEVPTRLPSLKAFTIKHLPANEIAKSLTEAFGRRSDAGVTTSESTNSLFVVGSRETLQIADQVVQQLDVDSANRPQRNLKVFPIEGIEGDSIVESLKAAFKDDARKIDVRADRSSGRLFVFADPAQMVQVEQVLASLRPEPRELQVLPLASLDPFVAKEAIDALYFDTPYNASPRITVDQDQQQLLIKATEQQQQQIRNLLEQMSNRGENPTVGGSTASSGAARAGASQIRFVPIHRHPQRILDELQKIWPTIRDNPIKIIQPVIKGSEAGANSTLVPKQTRFVSQSGNDQQISASDQETKADLPPTLDDAGPAVVIITGQDQWTLASEDTQALDHLERVLKLMLNTKAQPYLTTGNYSMYLLRRASASEMQQTLEQLLKSDRSSDNRRGSSLADLARRIKIVADSRTNALIVSGSVNDRQVIEELLGVLDSDDLIGGLQQFLPTLIRLESANIGQVESILKTIYRSQLNTSTSRKPIQIPEGVSAEVSLLLQQMNAEASSPLLTLTSDETTNSIILRGPSELTEEIRQFVQNMDHQTASTPSRRVDLIQLKSANTTAIESALKRMMSR